MTPHEVLGQKYGCVVPHPTTHEVEHWAEKPETFVSDVINCGIYILDSDMLECISTIGDQIMKDRMKARTNASPRRRQLFSSVPELDEKEQSKREIFRAGVYFA